MSLYIMHVQILVSCMWLCMPKTVHLLFVCSASVPSLNSKPAALASTSYPTTLNFGKPSSWTMGEYFFPNYANFGTTLLTADNSGLAGSISPPVTSVPYTEVCPSTPLLHATPLLSTKLRICRQNSQTQNEVSSSQLNLNTPN